MYMNSCFKFHPVCHEHKSLAHRNTVKQSYNRILFPLSLQYVGCGILLHSVANVLYKKYATRQEDPAVLPNAARYVGYIGVHTLFWLWPPIIILHYSRVEVFELPTEG